MLGWGSGSALWEVAPDARIPAVGPQWQSRVKTFGARLEDPGF